MPRKKVAKAAVLAAEKKYLDQDGLAHLVQKNDVRYVRKEDGKGLSANDFTDEYKQKIDELEAGAGNEIITEDEINGLF